MVNIAFAVFKRVTSIFVMFGKMLIAARSNDFMRAISVILKAGWTAVVIAALVLGHLTERWHGHNQGYRYYHQKQNYAPQLPTSLLSCPPGGLQTSGNFTWFGSRIHRIFVLMHPLLPKTASRNLLLRPRLE